MPDFRELRYADLFATPLVSFRWPDTEALNATLAELIMAAEAAGTGELRSNVGGWHSETGALEFCGEAGRTLVRNMYVFGDEATRRVFKANGQPSRPARWTLRAWANVNRPGSFNRVHTHPGATWSGTYYVDPGEPSEAAGTPIHFFDPCQGRANTFLPPQVPSSVTIRPEPGLMILFPSYLPHMVFPHQGGRPRISIAFNLRREPFP